MIRKIAFTLLAAVMLMTALQVCAEDIILISPAPNTATEQTDEAVPENSDEAVKEKTEEIVFNDISDDASFKDSVYKLVSNGVLNGYPDGSFRPAANITRAEMCKMINLTFGYVDTEGAAGFADLVTTEWYMPYVLAAQKAGYIKGDGDTGLFRPNDPISRQEVCVILCRVIKPYDLPYTVEIGDFVDEWARKDVETIVKNMIMPLEADGSFRATEPIIRSELAVAVAPYSNIKVEDIKCSVTFIDGEETVYVENVVIGKTLLNMPEGTKAQAGYRFAGWSLVKDERVFIDTNFTIYENKTLYAVYEKDEYSVKFMIDDTVLVSEQTVKFREFATAPASPARDGYTFKGWVLSGVAGVVDVSTYEISGNTVFNALFESNSGGGGGGGGGFGGGGNSEPDDDTEQTPETFTVNFIVDGNVYASDTVESDTTATPPVNPGKSGYVFKGWSKTEAGEIVSVSSVSITEDTSFYAVFEESAEDDDEPVVETYTVIFYSNGNSVNTQPVVSGGYANVPSNPGLYGFTFLYWSDSVGGSEVNVAEYPITADTSFYAVFEAIVDTVTFIADGEPHDIQYVNRGGKAALPDTNPEKEGYTFLYWSFEENGQKADLASYVVRRDTNLYAVFAVIKDEVKFYADGECVDTQSVNRGEYAVEPEQPELDGYTFLYWSDEEDGEEVDISEYKIMGPTSFYAVFELDESNQNDNEIVTAIKNAHDDLSKMSFPDTIMTTVKRLVVETLNDAYNEALNGVVITPEYIKQTEYYKGKINSVKAELRKLSDTKQSEFLTLVRNGVAKETFNILTEYFLDEDALEKLEGLS